MSGGTGLDTALAAAGTTGTVTFGDSLSYPALADAGSTADPIVSLLVRAGPGVRPVLRPAAGSSGPAQWIFTGGGGARLVLDGLTVSGCDIVLRGSFDTVRITACTIDPGTAAPGSPPLATAADGAPLAPGRIFVEADPAAGGGVIGQLLVDHCILGPVRTRFGGSLETVTVSDSIVQGLPATSGTAFTAADVFDPALLARGLAAGAGGAGRPVDALSAALLAMMPAADAAALLAYAAGSPSSQETAGFPLDGLNALVGRGSSLYDPALFTTVNLSPGVLALAAQAKAGTLDPARLPALNRALIDEAFPVALRVAALAVADATVQLTRVTVLGRIAAHRLSASDSILADFAAVDDTQDGCVRFSAYADGSAIPRQYSSAAIPPSAPIFTSEKYGQPGYAQLIETADTAITGGAGRRLDLLGGRERLGDGRLLRRPEPDQGAGPADQVRRVYAARPHARDRPCHMSIVSPGAGEGDADGRRPRTSELRPEPEMARAHSPAGPGDRRGGLERGRRDRRRTRPPADARRSRHRRDTGRRVCRDCVPAEPASVPGDLVIGPGTLYLGGERLDLDAPVAYSAQPDWLDHSTDPLWVPPAVPAAAGTSYELVYLLAAEQEVSAVEDPALADVALGGPDTMGRQRILQRFVRQPCQSASCFGAWTALVDSLGPAGQRFDPASMMIESTAALQVSFTSPGTAGPCQPATTGGYLGVENQMIRVMVTSVDASGVPTIVWGFDDASFLYPVGTASPDPGSGDTTLTLASAPVDSYHYPVLGQAVELLRDAVQLTATDYIASPAGFVSTLTAGYAPASMSLTISGEPPGDYLLPRRLSSTCACGRGQRPRYRASRPRLATPASPSR